MADSNSILQKLEGLVSRFEEVSTLITDPNVIADQERFVKLTREYKDLTDIMDARKRYISCLDSIKEAKDILVIGAGDGGVVRELTRYDRVERIDLVEMDPQVVEACRAYLPGNACRMDDRRVHIYFENALKYIRRCEEEYDLIIVDSSDPFGPSEGLFTREFYGSCFNALKEDGIMVNQQGSPFYAEDASAMQRSHKRIASTFPISRVYQAHIPTFAAGYWLFGFASKKYHPIDDLDADAWKALNLRTRYYTTRLHVGAFYLPAFLEEMLREVEDC